MTKTYPKASRLSLDDVSVSIDKGDFDFFIGPSGSGKSTLIKLLLHEITPNSDKVYVNDRTAYENVAFALKAIGKSKGVAPRVVPEVLELVGLGGKEHRYPYRRAVRPLCLRAVDRAGLVRLAVAAAAAVAADLHRLRRRLTAPRAPGHRQQRRRGLRQRGPAVEGCKFSVTTVTRHDADPP